MLCPGVRMGTVADDAAISRGEFALQAQTDDAGQSCMQHGSRSAGLRYANQAASSPAAGQLDTYTLLVNGAADGASKSLPCYDCDAIQRRSNHVCFLPVLL